MTFVRFPGDKSRSMRCDERSITPDRPFTPRGVYSAISLVAVPLAPRFDSADCTRRGCLCALTWTRTTHLTFLPISLKQPRTGFAAHRNSPGWPCRASNVRLFILPPSFSNFPIQVSSSVTVPSGRYVYHSPQDSLHHINSNDDMGRHAS